MRAFLSNVQSDKFLFAKMLKTKILNRLLKKEKSLMFLKVLEKLLFPMHLMMKVNFSTITFNFKKKFDLNFENNFIQKNNSIFLHFRKFCEVLVEQPK